MKLGQLGVLKQVLFLQSYSTSSRNARRVSQNVLQNFVLSNSSLLLVLKGAKIDMVVAVSSQFATGRSTTLLETWLSHRDSCSSQRLHHVLEHSFSWVRATKEDPNTPSKTSWCYLVDFVRLQMEFTHPRKYKGRICAFTRIQEFLRCTFDCTSESSGE